jgi:hypothetical protein
MGLDSMIITSVLGSGLAAQESRKNNDATVTTENIARMVTIANG